MCPHRLGVRTPLFQGGGTGSNPVAGTNRKGGDLRDGVAVLVYGSAGFSRLFSTERRPPSRYYSVPNRAGSVSDRILKIPGRIDGSFIEALRIRSLMLPARFPSKRHILLRSPEMTRHTASSCVEFSP